MQSLKLLDGKIIANCPESYLAEITRYSRCVLLCFGMSARAGFLSGCKYLSKCLNTRPTLLTSPSNPGGLNSTFVNYFLAIDELGFC